MKLEQWSAPEFHPIPRRPQPAPKNELAETWPEMVATEPALQTLFDQAAAIRDDKRNPAFCANWHWYRKLKPQMRRLVGWEASNPRLRSPKAYAVAYRLIYAELPACRNCACWAP